MSDAAQSHWRRARIFAPYRVIRARPQLLFSFIIGTAFAYMLPEGMRLVARALVGWNVGVLFYFATIVARIGDATHHTIRRRAQILDEGAFVILFITTAAAIASIGAIVMELGAAKEAHGVEKAATIGLTILTVFSSWMFLHLSFALHYAHEFYADDDRAADAADVLGGLNFPKTPTPQYIDFVYYAYVIGVACQTGDVDTTSARMRALTLVHGVVAFFYNTTVLALMVNIASQFV